jgi:hypothetical protein
MKNLILLIIISVFFGFSCSEDESNVATHISTAVTITVLDQQGADLLDPDNLNGIRTDKIKIFHKIDGELIEYFEGNMDCSKGFNIFNPKEIEFNEHYVFCLLMTDASYYTAELNLNPITYIQWKETDLEMDKVQCQYRHTDNSTVCIKVWYNDDLVWDAEEQGLDPRWFQIEKTF